MFKDKKDSEGNTELHLACLYNDYETIKFLIENGADVNAKDNNGQTPHLIKG